MAKKPELQHDQNFHMRVDEEFLAALDDLRTSERPVPSRAEYVRRVITELHRKSKKPPR